MISTAKISKKGQIVIPKEIRKVIGLGPGDRVIFTLTKKGALVTKQEGSPFDKYYGFLNKPGSSERLVRGMRGERNDIGD
jgi:AbrB family looped-hinge helix DNA binding protein